MIKRVIDISEGPTFLSIRDGQLILLRHKEEIASIPCEDVGLLMVESAQTTYTHAAVTRLLDAGAAVVLCGDDHLPRGICLPLENNDLHTARLRTQLAAPLPLTKRLWQQIVRHKIRAQALNLPADSPARVKLLALADEVKTADRSNAEGHAGRIYWPALMGSEFRRDPDGLPPNGLLNYGYTVFRAACARALVAGGLHPAVGLHHSNRSNPFCLADDLVEVFRPRVDATVRTRLLAGGGMIGRDDKQSVLSLLSQDITVGGFTGPLMVGLHRIVASLVRCLAGEQKRLDLPDLPSQAAQTDPERPETDTENGESADEPDEEGAA